MLRAFVEELGHEYESLFKSVIDDEPPLMNEAIDSLLIAAANLVKTTTEKRTNPNADDFQKMMKMVQMRNTVFLALTR